ncbi:hypothetical protein N657DRAFT_566883 [Parathielavia appendiculata]|uniref:Uncharacterized protein n=1 Tax=Parathielavia appendiculata TaxID=2587402 RepID=A0AAN6U6D3_9PEZI|nr:hypothetical protein N657DRAFT_566883 [Parathielavia appendiculata]
MSVEANELLDAFKAAALSVTKLYKTSAQAQAKSRADGYQDCLEDLLSFLDSVGSQTDAGLQRIRKWATDRLEGRDATSPPIESDDEAERSDAQVSSPRLQRAVPASVQRLRDIVEEEASARESSAPPILTTTVPAPPSPVVEEVEIAVPSQDAFNFQASYPYPHDEALRLANLNLSDSQTISASNTRATPRNGRNRNGRAGGRTSLGRGAGQKRKVNLAEIFDLGSLEHGNGKDMFGGGKRSRFA